MALVFISRDAIPGFMVSSSEAQVADRAVWRTPATGLFRPVKATDEAVSVDDSVNRVAAALIEKAGPVVANAINRHLAPVAENAFREWPVATGNSKAQLFFDIEVASDNRSISARIVNTAPYASGIRGGVTARELVFEPGIRAARLMARDIGKGLAE